MYRLFLIFSFIFSSQAFAQLGVESLDFWPRARVVPTGQSVLFLEGQFSQAEQQLDNNGQLVSLGQNRSQKVSWGDVASSAQQASDKAKIESELQNRGVSKQDTAAHFDFDVKKQQITQKIGWIYGLTPSWMVGVQVPVVHTKIQVETTATYSPMVDSMSAETQSQVKTYMKNELRTQGYTDFEERPEETRIGDLQLITQHRVFVKGASAVAVRGRWTFPSAQGPKTSDFFDLNSDDGQNDLGVDLLFDYVLGRRWSFTTVAGYTMQMPDSISVRKPVQDGQMIKSEVVRDVRRDLGDVFKLMISSEFRVLQQWRALGAWVFQDKSEDKFNKNFKEEPASQVHLAKVGLQYVTGANTLRRDVRSQWLVGLNHWRVLSGRNVIDSQTTTLDLTYFY